MRRAALLACLALSAAACAGAPSQDDTVLVVATPWPLRWLAAQVAPDAEIRELGQAGQDPHELDLSPAERELLDRADAILFVGPVGFQPQVEDAAAQRADVAIAVTAAAEELLPAADGHTEDGHTEDGHTDVDPHVWFAPRALARAAPALAERLAAVDPDGAEGYRDRAASTAEALRALSDELDDILSECRLKLAVVGHEAFAYLLEPRGLEQVGVSGVGGHGEVSPTRLAELTALIRREGIRTVLAEPVEGRAAAETLAREAGVALAEVDTLESPEAGRRALGLPELLREQARVFAQALECAP